ncbi:MAG: M23 family metallopeptidase [Rubrivivax sp.]|nr:M23 family metallopeptidase [Rubrivivax sp.]
MRAMRLLGNKNHHLRVHLPPLPAGPDLEQFGRRHRFGLIASFVALLTGTAITAVAVAPMVADPALLPQRLIKQTVQPSGLNAQLEALANQELTLTRNTMTRATDTLEAVLSRLGVRDMAAAQFLRSDGTTRQIVAGRGGKMVQARTDAEGTLQELVVRYPSDVVDQARTHFTRLTLLRSADARWRSDLATVPYSSQMRMASGTIRNTLFAATDEAGLPDSVAAQLSDIFATDVDFHRELRKGDSFSVVYESLTADGEPVPWNEGAGRVLAAEFVNGGRAHHAVWFAPGEGRGAYFDINGQSKRRAFLASPMEFSRVTSGFATRFHPLMQQWRRHLGVDYGAPIGTAVRSVAEGTVEFAGWQNGYGNVVQVKHGTDKATLYAHLSKINVKAGQRVGQGQHIGAVGTTGWSTGPHLHFEFRINGEHQDPLLVAKSAETVALDSASRPRFAELVRTVQAKLDVAESLIGQRRQGE